MERSFKKKFVVIIFTIVFLYTLDPLFSAEDQPLVIGVLRDEVQINRGAEDGVYVGLTGRIYYEEKIGGKIVPVYIAKFRVEKIDKIDKRSCFALIIQKSENARIEINHKVQFDSPLKPPQSPLLTSKSGTLKITSVPPGADIYLDGKNLNKVTDAVIPDIPIGVHRVTLKLKWHNDYSTSVNVVEGQMVTVNYDFSQQKGAIAVSSNPSGARIYLDDLDTEKETNDTLNNVDVGPHKVTLKLQGYANYSTTVTVTEGQVVRVSYDFSQQTGSIMVSSNPPGASIYMDDQNTGKITNDIITNVRVSTRKITLKLKGYKDYSTNVSVKPGQTVQVNYDFTQQSGLIAVSSTPTGARVYLDDQDIGIMTNATIPDVPAGIHKVRLQLIGYKDYSTIVEVKPDQIAQVDYDFTQQAGVLEVMSNPKGAAIYLDDQDTGKVTDNILSNVSVGQHKITLKRKGYTDYSVIVIVTADQTINISYDFTQQTGSLQVESVPEGARIFLDDVDTGRTTRSDHNTILEDIKVGQHKITLKIDGFRDHSVFTEVASNRLERIFFNFLTIFEFCKKWGEHGLGDGQFKFPYSVAVDNLSFVYVADTQNHRIQKFSSDGEFIHKWGTYGNGKSQFSHPIALAVDAKQNLYVLDRYNFRIQKFSSNGDFLLKWGREGSGEGEFRGPVGIAVDKIGYVYVLDMLNCQVQKFTPSGIYFSRWGKKGSGNGEFNQPTGIASDSLGNIYILDTGNSRIQIFDSKGTFLSKIEINVPINNITVDNLGNLYASSEKTSKIYKMIIEKKEFISNWGKMGSDDSEFNVPRGLTIDKSGILYVADTGNHRIQKFLTR